MELSHVRICLFVCKGDHQRREVHQHNFGHKQIGERFNHRFGLKTLSSCDFCNKLDRFIRENMYSSRSKRPYFLLLFTLKEIQFPQTINFLYLALFAIGLVLTLVVSKINPLEIDKFHNYFLIYFLLILFPPLSLITFVFVYYFRHQIIFQTVLKQMKEKIYCVE